MQETVMSEEPSHSTPSKGSRNDAEPIPSR